MRYLRIAVLCLAAAALMTASTALWADDADASIQWWGKAPGPKPVCKGHVAEVAPDAIGVETPKGVKMFRVDENTKVVVRGVEAGIDDVQVGDPVGVRFQLRPNDIPLAKLVVVPKPAFTGKIVAIEGDSITLEGKNGEQRLVVVTPDTKYCSHGYNGILADLRIGYGARAAGEIDGSGMVADRIDFRPAQAKGTVVDVQGDLVVLKTVDQRTIQCLAGPDTAVLVRPRVAKNYKGTLTDVQVGMPANIGFHPDEPGPFPLLWIEVLTGS